MLNPLKSRKGVLQPKQQNLLMYHIQNSIILKKASAKTKFKNTFKKHIYFEVSKTDDFSIHQMLALTTFCLCKRIKHKYCPLKGITHCKDVLVWHNAKMFCKEQQSILCLYVIRSLGYTKKQINLRT